MIDPDQIDQARSRNPLSAIVGRFVELRKAGAEWKARCPFHDERSPSFYVNDRKSFYHCFGCGAHGDAIAILMQLGRMSFNDAVEQLLGARPETSTDRFVRHQRGMAAQTTGQDADERDASDKARALFNAAAPLKGTLGAQYLRQRAISGPAPDCLRFAPAVPYWHEWKKDDYPTLLGKFPALIAAIETDTEICGVQITYLSQDGTKLNLPNADEPGKFLPAKKIKGSAGRGAVRLSRHAKTTLGLGEGSETALSAKEIYSLPVWATLGHARFAAKIEGGAPRVGARVVAIPKTVTSIIIFADRAKDGLIDPKASEAADSLEVQGFAVEVIAPAPGFKDFNEQKMARGKA